jgi:hypothetical protein
MLYRTSLLLGGGLLYLLLGFLFVFVLPTGILLGLGLPGWLAVTLGAATYIGLFVYLSVADTREGLSKHVVAEAPCRISSTFLPGFGDR